MGKKKTTGKRPETNYEQFKNQLGEEPYHLSHACGPKTSLSSHYNLHMVPRELMNCSFKSNESLEEPFRKLHRLNTCIHERKKSGEEWKSRGLVDVDKQKRHEEPIRQFKVARQWCEKDIMDSLKQEREAELAKNVCGPVDYNNRDEKSCLVLVPYLSRQRRKHFKYWINTCYDEEEKDEMRNNLFADYPVQMSDPDWDTKWDLYWENETYLSSLYDLFKNITGGTPSNQHTSKSSYMQKNVLKSII